MQRSQASHFRIFQNPRRKGISIGSLLGVLILVLIASYYAGKGQNDLETVSIGNDLLSEVKAENVALKQKLLILENNYQIELEVKKNLNAHLTTLQQQNTELVRDLALYQAVTGTSTADKTLQVKAFQLAYTKVSNTYQYLIVLAKQNQHSQYSQGVVRMTIEGKMGAKAVTLSVKYVDSQRKDGLAFKFRHFQELTGELSLPQGFHPHQVKLAIEVDKLGKFTEQTFPWRAEERLPLEAE